MNWGLLDHSEKRVFVIPIGKTSPEEAQKIMKKVWRKYHRDYFMEERRQKLDKIMGNINEKRKLQTFQTR